jgi:hypothetical protein
MKVPHAALAFAALSLSAAGAAAQQQPESAALRIGGVELRGDGPNYLDLGVGAAGIEDRVRAPAARVEFRYGGKILGIGPAVGVLANGDGAVMGYGALYADIAYRHVVITPFGGIGAYHHGGSRDLGGVFQFRIGVAASYEFDDGRRVGMQFAHISNSGIHDDNPGTEDLLLTYQIPF